MLEVCFADNNTWYILILVQTEQRLTLQTVMKQTVTVQVPSVSSIIYSCNDGTIDLFMLCAEAYGSYLMKSIR